MNIINKLNSSEISTVRTLIETIIAFGLNPYIGLFITPFFFYYNSFRFRSIDINEEFLGDLKSPESAEPQKLKLNISQPDLSLFVDCTFQLLSLITEGCFSCTHTFTYIYILFYVHLHSFFFTFIYVPSLITRTDPLPFRFLIHVLPYTLKVVSLTHTLRIFRFLLFYVHLRSLFENRTDPLPFLFHIHALPYTL